MSGRTPDQLAREVREGLRQRTTVDGQPTGALAALAELEAQAEAGRREADWQMGAKLDAQVTLAAVVKALDLRLDELGNGWKEATPKILARIETIVDEAERAFRERDAALAAAAPSPADQEENHA